MSDSESSTFALFDEFEPISTQEWEDVLTRDLKGADYKKKLTWHSIEGIEALPFYRREDLENIPHLADGVEIKTPAEWTFSEAIECAEPAEANKLAKHAVENGAGSLWFTVMLDPDEGVLGGDISGIRIQNLDDMTTLLDGIDPKTTHIVFNSGAGSPGMMGLVRAWIEESGYQESALQHSFSFLFDPFTYMAARGRLSLPEDKLNSLMQQLAEQSFVDLFAADGAFYHNCGATIIQELGISLAIASEILATVPKNLREKTANRIWLHLSAGSLYFPEIAKFRAARLLWMRLLDAYELDPDIPLSLHASTSGWNKAIADPHNNMLRATTEATAAAVGGADRLTVHPYNETFEEADEFSRRIARNVSHILDEESHLSAVDNPGDGSYYIEVLTDEIAKKSWAFFQMIEKQGGIRKALEANIIQTEVGKSRKQKEQALATRELVLTGVNHYPDADQELPANLFKSTPSDSLHQTGDDIDINHESFVTSLRDVFKQGVPIGDVIHSFLAPQRQLYTALKPYRAAMPFEELRLRTQSFEKSEGSKVTAQLIPIGNKKMRKARATFSRNYLGCAGFSVNSDLGFESVSEAAEKFSHADADIFVLCGADEEYPGFVDEFCNQFGDESVLILAGYPKKEVKTYRESGIDFFIYSGSDMLITLTEIQDKLGM